MLVRISFFLASLISHFHSQKVTPWKNTSNATIEHYIVSVVYKSNVKDWGPVLPENGIIHFSNIRDYLIPKLINGERAGMLSFEFAKKMERTIDQTLRNFYKENI